MQCAITCMRNEACKLPCLTLCSFISRRTEQDEERGDPQDFKPCGHDAAVARGLAVHSAVTNQHNCIRAKGNEGQAEEAGAVSDIQRRHAKPAGQAELKQKD